MQGISKPRQLSGRSSLPEFTATVDTDVYRVLDRVSSVTAQDGIRWFVVGAFARILLFEQNLGLSRGRATMDIDFAIMVDSWDAYTRLQSSICEDREFHLDMHQKQRMRHDVGTTFDLLPFGIIAGKTGTIRWPPDNDPVMSVMGFQESYDHAFLVTVNNAIGVPVVRPSCYVMLKLFAWDERGRGVRGKDAEDLAMILKSGANLSTVEDLFDIHLDAMEKVGNDVDLAVQLILGRELSGILFPETKKRLLMLLDHEIADGIYSQLVRDLERYINREAPEEVLQLLILFRDGIRGL